MQNQMSVDSSSTLLRVFSGNFEVDMPDHLLNHIFRLTPGLENTCSMMRKHASTLKRKVTCKLKCGGPEGSNFGAIISGLHSIMEYNTVVEVNMIETDSEFNTVIGENTLLVETDSFMDIDVLPVCHKDTGNPNRDFSGFTSVKRLHLDLGLHGLMPDKFETMMDNCLSLRELKIYPLNGTYPNSKQFLKDLGFCCGIECVKTISEQHFSKGRLDMLTCLSVGYLDLGVRGVQLLATGLLSGNCDQLSQLNMQGNNMYFEGFSSLSEVFLRGKCPILSTLKIDNNEIVVECMGNQSYEQPLVGNAHWQRTKKDLTKKTMWLGLACCSKLDTLSMRGNGLTCQNVNDLVASMSNNNFTRLKSLDIGGNAIEGKSAGYLLQVLLRAPKLIHLNMDSDEIRPNVWNWNESLAFGWLMSTSLTKMNLARNRLGVWNAVGLGDAMSCYCFPALEELDLTYTKIGRGGAHAIMTSINCCTRLYKLKLSRNQIGDRGADMLIDVLHQSPCSVLKELFISNNGFSSVVADRLAAVLQQSSSLTSLSIDDFESSL